jgi:hypothetical protein
MLTAKPQPRLSVRSLLEDPRIRQATHHGQTVYAVADLLAVLTEMPDVAIPQAVVHRVIHIEIDGQPIEALDIASVLRLVQSIDSPTAERIKNWLAATARERLEEAQDPELAIIRTRRSYEQHGYSRQWIDQRMRSVSARHELVGEWYRRGVRESEQFRQLTNAMMGSAFGMEVENYRRYKGLFRTGQNLRDHMTGLELSLTSLAETTAVELHRRRGSNGFDALLLDVQDAGKLVSATRHGIEQQTGVAVVSSMNHLPYFPNPRPPHRPAPAQARIAA